MDASVIVNTFNRKGLLLALLRELARQEADGFEVIVADDGSSDGTVQAVRDLARTYPHSLIACTQEKRGFRAARSRNNGALAAGSPQLIFIDDDCLPAPHYIAAYRASFAPGRLLRGDIIFVPAFDQVDHVLECKAGTDDLWGANFSLPSDLFWDVGGFDEDFVNEAGEDTDLHLRLLRLGVEDVRVEGAHVYHLGHHHAGGLSRNLFWDLKVHDTSIRRNTGRGKRP